MAEEDNAGSEAPDTGAIESKAKAMGWIPKEEFRGDPERFVEASEFVRRGEELMPILKATNRRQAEESAQLKRELAEERRRREELEASVNEVKEVTSQIAKDRAAAKKGELMEGIKAAREAGDVEKETELSQELTKLNNPSQPPAKERQAPAKFEPSPALKAWVDANPEFGKDPVFTGLANGIAAKIREELGTTTIPETEFYQKVSERLEEYQGGNPRRNGSSKVGESRRSEGGNEGGDKSYASLPAAAKEACDRQGERFIGPNKVYKTQKEWRNYYTSVYYKE